MQKTQKFLLHVMLLFVFIFYSLHVLTQNKTLDSLKKLLSTQKEDTNKVNILNAFAREYNNESDSINALQFTNHALQLAEKLNFKEGVGSAYFNMAWEYENVKNYTESLKNYFIAAKIKKETGDNFHLAITYANIANIYGGQNNASEGLKYYYDAADLYKKLHAKPKLAETYRLITNMNYSIGNLSEALKNQYSALEIYEELGDKNNITNSFQYLGVYQSELGNDSVALKFYFLALKNRKETGDSAGIAQTYISIGSIYSTERKYAQAMQYHNQGLEIFKELGKASPDWGIAYGLANIGADYYSEGNAEIQAGHKEKANELFSKSLEYHLATLSIWEKIGRKDGIASSDMQIGELYINLNQITKARNYLEKSLEENKNLHDKVGLNTCYLFLSVIDNVQRKYKQAYEDYQMSILYRDSVSNKENAKKNVQIQMQYDFDKKEAVAKAEQDKKDANAKRMKNQQYFAIAGLGLIVFAILIIALIQFRNNKQKQKANLLLESQKQKVEATLSELKSAQAQLIQSEKMASLGELTAGIAHEIQNPLNFVNNFSEVNKELLEELKAERLKPNAERDDDLQDDLINDTIANSEKISHHGKRADAIVKGMLQHSRSSIGVKELIDINALADEYLRLSYHGLRAKNKSFNATMKTDFDETIGKINIIPQDIGRVLLNLYNNAFYAVSERRKVEGLGYEPTISVSTKKSGNSISITVRDNGNGIPQKVIDKIFQPFFTTKPTGLGTGLGLSLSYDIVKAHGGEIKVNTKENEGSEFIIELPLK